MPYSDPKIQKEEASKRYYFKKQKGLCVTCGSGQSTVTTVSCQICIDKREQKRQQRIKNGLCSRCDNPVISGKLCEKHKKESRNRNNKKFIKRKLAKLCTKCGKPQNGTSTIYCESCRLLSIKQHILNKYKLSEVDYDLKVSMQNSKCKICNEIPKDYLCVDHNHITGKVQG